MWGYNPFFFAGYPAGIYLETDNHWATLFNMALGGILNKALTFNLAVLIAFLLPPIFAYFSADNFRLSKTGMLFMVIFSMFIICGDAIIRGFRQFGGYAFILSSFMSLYSASLLYLLLTEKRIRHLIFFTISGSLALFVHVGTFIILAAMCAPMLIVYFREVKLKYIIWISISAAIILAINSVWLHSYLKFLYMVDKNSGWCETYNVPYYSFIKVLGSEPPSVMIFCLSIAAILYSYFKAQKRPVIMCLFFSSLIFFVLTFCGEKLGILIAHNSRFKIPLLALMGLTISFAAEDWIKEKNFLFIATAFLTALSFGFAPGGVRISYKFGYDMKDLNSILSYLKSSTNNTSRIHVQDSFRYPYYASHFPAIIPYATSREIVAGPYTSSFTKNEFTQFINDRIFNRKIHTITDQKFKKYLELYNIRYFLVFSDNARRFFDNNTMFKKVFWAGKYTIYEYTDAQDSYVYGSRATVKADYDKIVVKNATAGKTILKYHYIDTLRIKPENLKIGPVRLLDDPIPFIKVENWLCPYFIIYNEGLSESMINEDVNTSHISPADRESITNWQPKK